jgi:hypothetical protein
MTLEIDKLKHFHVENWDGTNFADDLNDGEECSCLRGIRLEDVTVELEKEAYEEMRHNI